MSDTSKTRSAVGGGGGGAVYGLGLIGALVYYWQHAHGFWAYIWAIVEAILWPAFVGLSPARPPGRLSSPSPPTAIGPPGCGRGRLPPWAATSYILHSPGWRSGSAVTTMSDTER